MGFSRLAAAASLLLTVGCASTTPDTVRPADGTSFDQLRHVDGQPWDLLATTGEHKATVLVWYSATCPCVVRYQRRVQDLATRYADANVAVVGISSNSDDGPLRIQRHLAKYEIKQPIILDPKGHLAKHLGVSTTPAVVLVDQQGTVRYRGWIDNERKLGVSGREPWLEDALKSVLAREPVARATTGQRGCQITRSLVSACGRCPSTGGSQ